MASVGREGQDFGGIKARCPIKGAQLKIDGHRVRERESVYVCHGGGVSPKLHTCYPCFFQKHTGTEDQALKSHSLPFILEGEVFRDP